MDRFKTHLTNNPIKVIKIRTKLRKFLFIVNLKNKYCLYWHFREFSQEVLHRIKVKFTKMKNFNKIEEKQKFTEILITAYLTTIYSPLSKQKHVQILSYSYVSVAGIVFVAS